MYIPLCIFIIIPKPTTAAPRRPSLANPLTLMSREGRPSGLLLLPRSARPFKVQGLQQVFDHGVGPVLRLHIPPFAAEPFSGFVLAVDKKMRLSRLDLCTPRGIKGGVEHGSIPGSRALGWPLGFRARGWQVQV